MTQDETTKALALLSNDNLPTIEAPQPRQEMTSFELMMDKEKFGQLQRVATLFASSALVPKAFQGNVANTFIGLHMAMRLGVEPIMFLQKCYVVNGKPAIEAQLAIALVNSSNKFTHPLDWEFKGKAGTDDYSCTCYAQRGNKKLEMTLTLREVKANGWWGKNDSFWPKMTEQMFRYRTAMLFARVYCPEILLGLYSKDELEDVSEPLPTFTSTPSVSEEV